MPRDLKDVEENTFHCCYCGRRFKTEGELRSHYKLWGKVHFGTSVFKPCQIKGELSE
jgi:hypothetical protein